MVFTQRSDSGCTFAPFGAAIEHRQESHHGGRRQVQTRVTGTLAFYTGAEGNVSMATRNFRSFLSSDNGARVVGPLRPLWTAASEHRLEGHNGGRRYVQTRVTRTLAFYTGAKGIVSIATRNFRRVRSSDNGATVVGPLRPSGLRAATARNVITGVVATC